MEISPEKSETVAFLGEDAVRYEIIVDNKCLQQVMNFKYLGCEISYGNEKDIQQKPAQFAQILGILKNTFIPTLVKKFSKIKIYNALALPIILYGSEIWTLRK
jgi:hypothetical protein